MGMGVTLWCKEGERHDKRVWMDGLTKGQACTQHTALTQLADRLGET